MLDRLIILIRPDDKITALMGNPYSSFYGLLSFDMLSESGYRSISTTNLAACVCVSSKFDQFLPVSFYFVSKRPENFVRIAKFPYAAFGPLFAFHCPLFVTKNNNLGWNRHHRFATHRNCRCNDHGRRYCLRADNRR